jgi:vinculin
MPPSFVIVEEACRKLQEAADGLGADQSSQLHHVFLLEGARGILQGVSSLLLVFDQAEVRKIVRVCEGIIDYIKVAEVVESMEELVTFTKNLSPGMTSMTKQVDGRTEDLTNPSHADILTAENDQVKRALPLLLSSMKAFVTLKREQRKGAAEAQENRNYIMMAITESIQEIIRVLQLTSPTEEQGAFAVEQGVDQAGLPGGLLPGSLAAKVYQAKELVSRTGADAEVNRQGIEAVKSVLKEARKIARTLPPEKRAAIEEMCNEIEALMQELADLQARGLGDSARAKEIAALLGQKMDSLEVAIRKAIARKVVEDFKDPFGPLKAMTEAAYAPPDVADREEVFVKKAAAFQKHSKSMADTAASLAKSGAVTDKRMADELIRTAAKVKKVAPQVEHAARIVLDNPDSEAAKENYDRLKEEYEMQVNKLTGLVHANMDTVEFLEASEDHLRETLEAAKALIKTGKDPQLAFQHVSSAARTAKLVESVAEGEIENTEDPTFKANLTAAKDRVDQSIGPMVASARSAITQPGNSAAHEVFCTKADDMVSAVHDVHEVVDKHYNPPPPPPRPPSPTPEPVQEPPPRPPSPEAAIPLQSENPIGYAAHQLDKDAKQWEDNAMVLAARKMAKLMMQMAQYARGEGGEVSNRKQLIQTAKLIVKESEAVVAMARKVAEACTDKRMKRAILQVVDKIPTIATQLKIIAAVKATRQGGDDEEADREASEMLTDNAQNLMGAVSEVLYATEAATIRVPEEKRKELGLQWVKRN